MNYAQNAATKPRVVRTVEELKMALEDKARGQRIAALRKRKRLTQQAMASRLQIGYRTYQTWEAGTMPEWHNLEKLALDLGVRVEDIIGEDEAPGPSRLDAIEAKLNRILELLGDAPEVSASPTALAEVLEEEARRQDEQREQSAAASVRSQPKGSTS